MKELDKLKHLEVKSKEARTKLIEAQQEYNLEIRRIVDREKAKVEDQYQMGLIGHKEYFTELADAYAQARDQAKDISFE